jgi:ABC-type glycerol-3-phosphate transport system substrate-binding protein
VPKTWAQLLSITKKIHAAGKTPTPWALGAWNSWTLTDWFENIYIRTAGPAKYSQLFAGKLRFDHPSVISALRRMTTILNDRYVAGGYPEGARDGLLPRDRPRLRRTRRPPLHGGWLRRRPRSRLRPEAEAGEDDRRVDNPQVQELLRYLTSPAAARIWVSTGETVSTNKRVPLSAYPNDLARAEAKQVAGAKAVRYDGSDLLPGSLAESWGSTLQKVIQNPEDIPNLMKDFQRKAAREFKK